MAILQLHKMGGGAAKQWRHRPRHARDPGQPDVQHKPNSLIYGARYDRMMEAFGGKGFFVEDPKDLKGALAEAMNHRGPALVNVVISQGAARKPQQFRWHSCAADLSRKQGRAPLARPACTVPRNYFPINRRSRCAPLGSACPRPALP